MSHLAVAAFGADRPGIVAAVSRVFAEHECNIEDSAMTLLRGRFSIMMIVDTPESVGVDVLQAALDDVAAQLDLVVVVRPVSDEVGPATPGTPMMISVYGSDRPGIVHGVSSLLADRGVNITDVETRVLGDPDRPVYAMLLEVDIPATCDADALRDDLARLGRRLGVETSLHLHEADIL